MKTVDEKAPHRDYDKGNPIPIQILAGDFRVRAGHLTILASGRFAADFVL